MKKLFIAAAILSLAVSGWAQGTIDFRNAGVTFSTDPTRDRLVYADVVGGRLLGNAEDGSTAYVAGLFFVAGADGAEGEMQLAAGGVSAMRVETSTRVGQWSNVGTAGGNTRVLTGVADGVATVQVRVWDSSAFGSFAEAVAGGGLYGVSDAWNYQIPAPGSPPDQFYLNGLHAFALVPEPSVIALGVLGAASLLLFRRRK